MRGGPRGGRYQLAFLVPVVVLVLSTLAAARVTTAPSPRAVVGSAFARTEAAGTADFKIVAAGAFSGPQQTDVIVGTVDFRHQALIETQRAFGQDPAGPARALEIGGWYYSQVPRDDARCYGDGGYWDSNPMRPIRPVGSMGLEAGGLVRPSNAAEVGAAKLGGVAVTGYKVQRPAGSDEWGKYQALAEYVWVDSRGRARREAWRLSYPRGTRFHSGPTSRTESVTFSNFGAPVHIRVPSGYGPDAAQCHA